MTVKDIISLSRSEVVIRKDSEPASECMVITSKCDLSFIDDTLLNAEVMYIDVSIGHSLIVGLNL